MAHYVYSDTGQLVPPVVKVFELPEGGWVTFEGGTRRTVTSLKDAAEGAGITIPQTNDYFAALKAQLANIEAKIDLLLTAAKPPNS